MPALMIYILYQPMDTIRDVSFRNIFGSFYEGMKVETKWQICANLIFMLRRASFALICFNLEQIPGVQIILINLINLASCIYYGGVQPFDTRLRRRIDLFNEYSILVITWHMMCYTGFVGSTDVQWLVGWSMILCICLNALVNIIIVLWVGGR